MACEYVEFLETLKKKRIIVYGAGYIAKTLFYRALKMQNLLHRVDAFCVTKVANKNESFAGIPIREIDEIIISEDVVICIAVHESIRDEIINILKTKKVTNYVWVYPYLFRMILGEPEGKGREVSVDKVVRCTCEIDYGIPIRYAMVENYFGKNNWGQELYIKSREIWSGRENAVIRAQGYVNLIKSWEVNGYDASKRISIFDNYEVFDGAHRLALAKYFQQEMISCDIWKNRVEFAELYGENAVCSREVLLKGGFTVSEMRKLDEMKEKLEGK